MAKRFITVFFVTIAVIVVSFAIFCLVLFLAPGFSVFGIKYVAHNTHTVSQEFYVDDKVEGTHSGSFEVQVENIPVYVEFSQGHYYKVEYYDNYCGLTSSDIEDPKLNISLNNGTAVIKIETYKKFIFENSVSKRYLKLIIPASKISFDDRGVTDLVIKSTNSSVIFYDEKEDGYYPHFHEVNITTNGNVSIQNPVKADTYKLTTINSIYIDDSSTSTINATNYILNSTGGNIKIKRDVAGDLTATTNNASFEFLSCGNLDVETGWGDVSSSSSEAAALVRGTAKIKTTAGNVTIGRIEGVSAESLITTKTGIVKIKRLHDASISTTRGDISVDSCNRITATTGSGRITVETALSSATATSKRGKIFLGGESCIMNNPTVTSTFGDVYLYSASGNVSVEATDSNLLLNNTDAVNTVIKVGGKITGSNLTGKVNLNVEGSATLSFAKIVQDVNIAGKNGCGAINVYAYLNNETDLAYVFEGASVNIYERSATDLDYIYQIEVGETKVAGGSIGQPKITIINEGAINFYRGAVAN